MARCLPRLISCSKVQYSLCYTTLKSLPQDCLNAQTARSIITITVRLAIIYQRPIKCQEFEGSLIFMTISQGFASLILYKGTKVTIQSHAVS